MGHLLAMEKGRKGHQYILGGINCTYEEFFDTLRDISGVKVKLKKVPLWLQNIFARIQLFKGEYLGGEPLITPKWIGKTKYDWEVDSSKAIEELGLPVTPLKIGLEKTVEYLRTKAS